MPAENFGGEIFATEIKIALSSMQSLTQDKKLA
jgi:hypothetical protein